MAGMIHVLTGCTAVGKTETALRWAERFGAEIVSCDSLLFYRGMDVGTAKPAPEERERVPHHLVDTCEVRERMDVAHYVRLAVAAVESILGRGRRVLVAGGSGFYLRAFFAPVADEVDVPAAVRADVERLLAERGLEALVRELRQLNPGGLGGVDVRNPRRVARALERCRVTGRTLAELRREFDARPGPFAGHAVKLRVLDRERPDLDRRITARVDAMLRAGLVGEVRRLRAEGLEENPSAARAIGYRETLDFLSGRLPEAELAPLIARNTRALVRKQRTWFRTQLPPHEPMPAGSVDLDRLFDVPPVQPK